VTYHEVYKALNKLKYSKSKYLYDMSSTLVKYFVNIIVKLSMHCINIYIKKGIFKNMLKISKVIPIYKHGDSRLSVSYRPISLVPVLVIYLK
jgi:hypothetical protein